MSLFAIYILFKIMIGIYLGFVPNFNPSKKSIGRLAKWNRNLWYSGVLCFEFQPLQKINWQACKMEQKLGYSSAYCSEFQPLQKINWQTCKMEQKP